MPKYAEKTTVPVEKTQAEINLALRRYGATEFVFGCRDERAVVGFKLRDRSIRFILPLPDRNAPEFTHCARVGREKRTEREARSVWEQAGRQRWRALLLCTKAKLESVEAEIETVEEAFMAQILLPGSDQTIGEAVLPAVVRAYEEGSALPELLPMLALPALPAGRE